MDPRGEQMRETLRFLSGSHIPAVRNEPKLFVRQISAEGFYF